MVASGVPDEIMEDDAVSAENISSVSGLKAI
jgi:hypothetical protein